MGWDAFAIDPITRQWVGRSGYGDGKSSYQTKTLPNPIHDSAFAAAVTETLIHARSYDWMLRIGGLDCSPCAYMIEAATGENCWSEEDWEPEFVQQLNEDANWDQAHCGVTDDNLSFYWSARTFLQACADQGLAITFSW